MSSSSTLIVSNIPYSLSESDFEQFVQDQVGISEIDFQVDDEGNSKGLVFITYDTPENASTAFSSLSQQKINNRALRVKFDQSNYVTRRAISASESAVVRKTGALFVSNIPSSVSSKELRDLFQQYGELIECTISRNQLNNSKNVAFVTFKNGDVALDLFTSAKPLQINDQQLGLLPRSVNPGRYSDNSKSLIEVSGVPTLNEEHIHTIFSEFGEILSVKINDSNESPSFLVQFKYEEFAKNAIKFMNDQEVEGHSGRLQIQQPLNKLQSPRTRQKSFFRKRNISSSSSSIGGSFTERNISLSSPFNLPATSLVNIPSLVPSFVDDSITSPSLINSTIKSSSSAIHSISDFNLEYPISKRKPTRDEIGALQFFTNCVYLQGDSCPRPWVDISKRLKLTYEQIRTKLNQGSHSIGETRAKLLNLWYILLLDCENENPIEFEVENTGNFVTFVNIFINSKAIENIIESIFEDNISSQNPVDSFNNFTSKDLLLKIFSITLIGKFQFHQELFESIERLSSISQVSKQLKENIAQLFSCLKKESTDSRTQALQLNTIDAKIQEYSKNSGHSSEILELLREKWSIILKQSAGGNIGDLGLVYQSLSSEIGYLTATISSGINQHKVEYENYEKEVLKLKQLTNSELENTSQTSDISSLKIKSLNSKKDFITSEISQTLEKLEILEKQKKVLEKRKLEISEKVSPLIIELNDRKIKLRKLIEIEEKKSQNFQEVIKSFEECQKFIKKPNKNKSTTTNELSNFSVDTLQIVTKHLSTIFETVTKFKTRIGFCKSTVQQMEKEFEEMSKYEFDDVANDIRLGINKLNKEIQEVEIQLKQQINETNRVCSWLSGLQKSGLMKEDTSKVVKLQMSILG